VLPVPVNLPTGTSQGVPVVAAPPPNRLMRLVELTVRPVMGRCGNGAGWGGRADHYAVTREWGSQFDTYFKVDPAGPVHRDMPTCPWPLQGARAPTHGASGVGSGPGELG